MLRPSDSPASLDIMLDSVDIVPPVLVACGCVVLTSVILSLYESYSYFKRSGRSLKAKHVVITGGSSGIGKSLACEAAKRGADVTIIARNETKLSSAKDEILKACKTPDQKVNTVSLDISSNYEEIEKAFDCLENDVGPIYSLINCAGSAVCGTLEDTSAADIKRIHELNFLGSAYATKAVLENMKSRGFGHITFVSSMAAFFGIYGFAAYSASKYALRGFAEALHMEVAIHGLKVTISYPPDTDTPGFAEEEKTKPKETRLISNSAGLFSPDKVAKKILDDTLAGVFTSAMGQEGFLLSTLCCGMTPYSSVFNLLIEVCLMGFIRLIIIFYLRFFNTIISRCHQERNKAKRAE